ncbi:MAG: hypothetical protein AB7W16_20555 [Candidatus Obscuribacterales bacterium]
MNISKLFYPIKFLVNSIALGLIQVLSLMLGMFFVTVPLLIVFLATLKYAPKQFLLIHLWSLVPTIMGLAFLVWGAYWYQKVGKGEIWQGNVLSIAFWITVIVALSLIFLFREHWKFFVPLIANEVWFASVCCSWSGMCIYNVWL